MILPIVVYGDPVLRKVAEDIEKDYPNLDQLIKDMFDTMYAASGVGLAAPQVGKPIRLFIVDTEPFVTDEDDEDYDEDEFTPAERKQLKAFKKIFINARIVDEQGEPWKFREGCLSIPKIREEVLRKDTVTIEYLDENFKKHTETYDGLIARVIQHEYDHIQGVLFTDKISPFIRKLISSKLNDISKGKVSADYKIKVYTKK
jgi:peptide deformylase